MLLNINYYYFNKILQGKLCVWSLSFIQYFNLIHSFSLELIWSLTSQCHVNLIHAVISLRKIANLINRENKKN